MFLAATPMVVINVVRKEYSNTAKLHVQVVRRAKLTMSGKECGDGVIIQNIKPINIMVLVGFAFVTVGRIILNSLKTWGISLKVKVSTGLIPMVTTSLQIAGGQHGGSKDRINETIV